MKIRRRRKKKGEKKFDKVRIINTAELLPVIFHNYSSFIKEREREKKGANELRGFIKKSTDHIESRREATRYDKMLSDRVSTLRRFLVRLSISYS